MIEGLNALGDMFIRHNALNKLKNTNNTRPVIQALEQGFNLVTQMIDSRVSFYDGLLKHVLLTFFYFRF